jgi:hypothetical protein
MRYATAVCQGGNDGCDSAAGRAERLSELAFYLFHIKDLSRKCTARINLCNGWEKSAQGENHPAFEQGRGYARVLLT